MKLRALIAVGVVFWFALSGVCSPQTDTGNEASVNGNASTSVTVPRLIKFSGAMTDLAGKPLSGPVDLHFSIYREQTDAAPLWQETQTLNLDEQGHYTVLLGAMQPEGLPLDLFTSGEARWLGVAAGTLPEQPRTLLVSVPYALKAGDAETLGGKPPSAFMLAQPAEGPILVGAAAGGTTAPSATAATSDLATRTNGATPLTLSGSGWQNWIPLWMDNNGTLGDSAIYQQGYSVGIGTSSPATVVGETILNVFGTNPALAFSNANQIWAFQNVTARNNNFEIADFTTPPYPSRFVITTGGTVGIGTTTPTTAVGETKLNVFGANPAIAFSNANQIWAFQNVTARNNNFEIADFTTYPYPSRFVIATSGNVGIGTTTPAYPLDVAGNINSSGTVTASSFTGSGAGLTGVALLGTPITGNETINGDISATTSSGNAVSGTSTATTGQVYGVDGVTNSTTTLAAGVNGQASGSTGIVFGVTGFTNSSTNNAAGVQGVANATTGQVYGVSGFTNSTTNTAAGVWGTANASTGQVYGVSGTSYSTTTGAAGVTGNANVASGQVYGVNGNTTSATDGAAGVTGFASATTGQVYGVIGYTNSGTSGATGAAGVYGYSPLYGVVANGTGPAGVGLTAFGTTQGVNARGNYYGIEASGLSPSGVGVLGQGYSYGVYGQLYGTNGTGVYGTGGTGVSGNGTNYGVQGYASATTGAVFGVSGSTASTGTSSAGVFGGEGATTGLVFGVWGSIASTTDGATGVNGYEGATTGVVYGVGGGAASSSNGAAGVYGNETATTGAVYGVNGSTSSTTTGAVAVNGFEGATTGMVFGVSGGTNSTTNGAAGVFGGEGATTGQVFGVNGVTNSTTAGATGVNGVASAATGVVYGVSGVTSSNTAGNAGVVGSGYYGVSGISTTSGGSGVYGATGSGSYAGYFAGNVTITTCLVVAGTTIAGTCSSDARLKTNIRPFSPVLGKLTQLQPVHFNWRAAAYPEYHFGSATSSGLIAQEVEKVFPELVTRDARGFKQVNYSELPYLMLQAIRELKAENDTLRAQVEELRAKEAKTTDLARQVEELRAVVARIAGGQQLAERASE